MWRFGILEYEIKQKIGKMCEKSFADEGTYLYIDRHGNVYPSCRTYIDPIICTVDDKEALFIINKYFDLYNKARGKNVETLQFDLITVELSNICHASCIYCFQNSGEPFEKYNYYDELLKVLLGLKSNKVFFAGGEILDQKESINFIRKYRANTDSWLHLKTNGHFNENMAYVVKECFDSIMVSFNGFSETSYKTIMGINDIEITKRFCAELKRLGVNLCLKFLCSPIDLQDIPVFLTWAFSINPQSVVLQEAFLYEHDENYTCKRIGSVFSQLSNSYWTNVYRRIAIQISEVVNNLTVKNVPHFLCADEGLLKIFPLDEEVKNKFDTSGIYNLE